MNIKGKYELPATVEMIWPMLQEAEVLGRIAPGVSTVDQTGPDQYKAVSQISIGPVRGEFEGQLSLENKKEKEEMTMVLQQKSKIGNAEARITMNLAPVNGDHTLVSYNGKAKVSGKLGTMGQRILGGVVSTLSKQVFKELEVIIQEREKKEDSSTGDSAQTATSTERKSIIQFIKELIKKIWR